MAEKEFPEIKEKNQGKFTAWVENNMSGKTTCKAASIIVNKNKEEEDKGVKPKQRTYKPSVLKMANYANNFGCSTAKSPAKRSTDPPETQAKIKKFIKQNMANMTDKELVKKVRSMSDNKTEYNWNTKTGQVESHQVKK